MTITSFASPLCVALDDASAERNIEMARLTEPSVGLLKVGLTSYINNGPDYLASLIEMRPVFLDLKLHDIPAQVAGAVAAVRRRGARLTTVHASGGGDMVAAAVDAAGDGLAVLAVTILTSLDAEGVEEVGFSGSPESAVLNLAEVALARGARGLVCSPLEVEAIRSRFGREDEGGPLLVVPGIRSGPGGDDQRRTMGAAQALKAGADVLVVGRPITEAASPAEAAADLLEEARPELKER